MEELKVAIFFFMCLTLAKANFYNISSENMTHISRDSFYDSATLKIQNQLVHLSYSKVNADVKIQIQSTAIPNAKKFCEIKIRVPLNSDLWSPKGRFLGNEKLLVAFIETRLEEPENAYEQLFRFYVINFDNDCSYDNYSVLLEGGIFGSYHLFSIIPYENSFDIVVKNSTLCQPEGSICLIRYNETGEFLGVRDFDFPTIDQSVDLVKIQPVFDFKTYDSYVFISEQKSNLRILSPNLQTIKEMNLTGFILTESILNGDIGVCHLDQMEPHTVCLKMDSRFKIKFNVRLSNSEYYLSKRMYNVADGSSLLVSFSNEDMKIKTIVRRLSVDGRISQPELYRFECKSLTTSPLDHFVELKGGIYCFSFECEYKAVTYCFWSAVAKNLMSYT